jgi:protein-tyrosine phosphatase
VSAWFAVYGFAQVADQLLVGAYPLDDDDVRVLGGLGVRRVLNLVQDEEYEPGQRSAVENGLAAAGIIETRMRLVDYGRLPPAALEAAVEEVCGWLRAGNRSYIHCRAGWQRSAAVAAGVIAVREKIGIEEALDLVRARKPRAEPLPHQREDLIQWWTQRGSG